MIKRILSGCASLLLLVVVLHAQPVGQLPAGTVWGNSTAARAPASPATMTGMIDRAISSTQGAVMTRNATGWIGLAPGTSGLPLLSGGAGANLAYGVLGAAGGGTGTGTYAVGDILYANTTTTLARRADVAVGSVLVSGGVNLPPVYSANPSLTSIAVGGCTIGTNAFCVTGTSLFGGNISASAAGVNIGWLSSTQINAPSDGVLTIGNNAGTSFSRLQFGGTTASFPAIKRNSASLDIRLADDSGYADFNASNIAASGSLTAGVYVRLSSGNSVVTSPSSGVILLQDSAATNFGRLQFGGTTSSFPAIKRSSATLAMRLADDSADANVSMASLTVSSNIVVTTNGANDIGASGNVFNNVNGVTFKAAPANAIPAGGLNTAGFVLYSTANFGLFGSAGAPTFSAAKGAIALDNTGGIPYYNNNGTTGWTALAAAGASVTCAQLPALTGDVTTSAGACATTIAANAVTYAKFQQVAAGSIVANTTGILANAAAFAVGTGVFNALGNNAGTANGLVIFNGALGTPSSGVATNLTGTASGLTAGAVPASGITGTTLASNVVTTSITTVGTLVGGATGSGFTVALGSSTVTGSVALTNGGAGGSLTASNGGIVYSDASRLQILAGTVTSGQCLLSGSSAAPTWGACAGGAAVSSVTAGDTTLTISPTTGAVVAQINLARANTWTGALTLSGVPLITSGNFSAAAWTTAGVRVKSAAASYTDTSSSGTVATAYTDFHGAGTILASSSTTYTNYFGAYFVDPVASTNVTMTNKWALGSDSAKFGTSNQITISTAGVFSVNGNAMTFPAAAATLSQTIASGAKTLATSAIASAACSSAQTDTATGAATTDAVAMTFNADPTAVTGYVPLTTGMLTIIGYPTANTVNFKVCNNTGSSITPGAVTINWRVVR